MSDTADPSGWPAPSADAGAARAEAATRSRDDVAERVSAKGCLVAIRFPDPLYAQEAMLATVRLRARKHLELDDAAIVTRAPGGRVRIQQTRDVNVSDGALSGGWWGVLAGLFLANPLIGGALGAALGGLWAKLRDVGISDDEMRELGDSLSADEAVLFLLVTDAHRWHALNEARRFPGTVFHTTLSPQDEADLRTALGASITTL